MYFHYDSFHLPQIFKIDILFKQIFDFFLSEKYLHLFSSLAVLVRF